MGKSSLTALQRLVARFPRGCRVVCIDAQEIGNGHRLEEGNIYTIAGHERVVKYAPLLFLKEFAYPLCFSRTRFRRVE